MSASIVWGKIADAADPFTIPTVAERLFAWSFRFGAPPRSVIEDDVTTKQITDASVDGEVFMRGGKVYGYCWRFSDMSFLTINKDAGWVSR